MKKEVALISFWIVIGLVALCDYVYLLAWLFSKAITFQWGFVETFAALAGTGTAIAFVCFLTAKVNNILIRLAMKGRGCYTVYMSDKINSKEDSAGELLIRAIGWMVLGILGFWGVAHVLLSLMDAL